MSGGGCCALDERAAHLQAQRNLSRRDGATANPLTVMAAPSQGEALGKGIRRPPTTSRNGRMVSGWAVSHPRGRPEIATSTALAEACRGWPPNSLGRRSAAARRGHDVGGWSDCGGSREVCSGSIAATSESRLSERCGHDSPWRWRGGPKLTVDAYYLGNIGAFQQETSRAARKVFAGQRFRRIATLIEERSTVPTCRDLPTKNAGSISGPSSRYPSYKLRSSLIRHLRQSAE